MRRIQRALSRLLTLILLAGVLTLPASAISDVPEDFWAKENIDRCVANRYFYLESDGTFGVGKEMSRAEFVAVLCRVLGWKPASPARAVYGDVDEKAWYAGALETAYHQGAITAQDGNFRPEEPVTRSEAASMLVRALGYGSIAGLVQDMSLPFRDVKANNGYIFMAYGMGLMDGTSVTTFSPNDHVTREQAAAMIMRLHDRLYSTETGAIGVACRAADLPDLKGLEAVGVAAAKLTYNGEPQLSFILSESETKAIRYAASAAGAKALLYITGGSYHVREDEAEKLAAVLLDAVEEGLYDGLFLDVTGLTGVTQRDELTAAASILKEAFGEEKLLYIGAEAPSWKGTIFGYDYAALGEIADRLVLRFSQKAEKAGDQTVSPVEPVEQIYYALNRLRGVVDAGKLTLMLTSVGTEWMGREFRTCTAKEIESLLAARDTREHYSSRYACAYLIQEKGGDIWYHNAQSMRERARLAQLFGGVHLCLSNLNDALPEVLEVLPRRAG